MGRNSINSGAILNAFFENQERISLLIDNNSFRQISKTYDIPSELMDEVKRQLCSAAFIYTFVRDEQKSDRGEPLFQEIMKELHVVERLAHQLASKLEHLSDAARSQIESVENAVDHQMVANWDRIETSSFGHRIYRHLAQDGGETRTYLHLPQITQAVLVLHNMTKHILAVSKPGDKGGRPSNEAMWLWVVNAYIAWTQMLGRSFTFDQHDGGPITPAGRFCWQALQLIDHNANWAEFCTAMRRKVRLHRPGRGRRPRG